MKIKRILPFILGFSLLSITSLEAQQAFGGKPRSFSQKTVVLEDGLRAEHSQQERTTPTFTVYRQHSAEELRAAAMKQVNAPMNAGEVIEVNYNLTKDGERVQLTDGTIIYRLRVHGVNAKSIYLFFSKFLIPNGGKLYIYNPDKSILLGAYTEDTNPTGGEFAVEPILGDELILEYEAPSSIDLPKIEIDGVGYLYYAYQAHTIYDKAGEDEVRTSCQEEANCHLGEGWDDQKNSIVQILIRKGGHLSLCSGTLLNNTNRDFKPYIITAGHCAAYREGDYDFNESDLNRWIFSFHYIKPSCSRSTLGSIEGKSLIGCRKLVYLPMHEYSDGMLLELNQYIPLDYRVYYSGWDRSGEIPSSGVSLHHPMADAMKISVFDTKPSLGKWDGFNKGAEDAHLLTTFTHGETEGGSSGGGMFDGSSKKLIATLTGGLETSKCLPYSKSFYGRLSYHWDHFKAQGNTKRMDIYLDPKGQGQAMSIEGTYREDRRYFYPVTKVLALRSRTQKDLVQIKWSAPKGIDDIKEGDLFYDIRRDEVILERIKHIKGQQEYSYVDNISVQYGDADNYVYSIRAVMIPKGADAKTEWTSWSEPVGVYLGELPKEVPTTAGTSSLSWTEPEIYQEWTRVPRDGKDRRFTEIPMAQIEHRAGPQVSRQGVIKYGEKWPMGSLYEYAADANYSPAYIKQINVLPRKAKERFNILLDYGQGPVHRPKDFTDILSKDDYERKLSVKVPDNWKEGEWLTVVLDKPLKIYPEYMLRVSFETSNGTKEPSSMCYMKLDETSSRYRFVGPLVMIMVNSQEEWYTIYKMSEIHKMIPQYWQGNMAFRFIVGTDAHKLDAAIDTERVTSYSSALPALPRPTAYDVYQGDNKVATIQANDKKEYSYNATGSGYVVKPVYTEVPDQLDRPASKSDVSVKITTEGNGSVKLYGYPHDTKSVKTGSVVWIDAYPESGYELESITANGQNITYTGEVVANGSSLNIVAKFRKASHSTSIETITHDRQLSVYPNPVRSEARVEGLVADEVVRIYTMDGRLVYEVTPAESELRLDASNFAPGVYLLQTPSGKRVKFAVEY